MTYSHLVICLQLRALSQVLKRKIEVLQVSLLKYFKLKLVLYISTYRRGNWLIMKKNIYFFFFFFCAAT